MSKRRQSKTWLKMIGTSQRPCEENYRRNYVGFRGARRPSIRPGDRLVLYAVGSRRIFALANVISPVEPHDNPGWPLRVKIEYIDNICLPVSCGVEIDAISTERNLLLSLRRRSHIRLGSREYDRASSLLRQCNPSH